jgi:Protein of unknown function (DUF3631)
MEASAAHEEKEGGMTADIHMLSNRTADQVVLDHDLRQGDFALRAVERLLARFIDYPSEHARVAHALWCVHAHMMECWDTTPRLAFLSPEPASGKTRALEITELLVPRPVSAVNVSPAYLFRKVASEEGAPTILFDEIDTVFGPKAKENEEIRGLLNAGHRRGAVAGRCVVRGKTIETEEIPAYAAVALAGLGWLPDTIMSRSVVIRMRRRAPGEHVEPFRRRLHGAEGDRVRAQVEVWAAAQSTDIDFDAHPLPAEIQDRDADLWEPLVAIADLAGGDWPARARAAAVALVAAAREREPSLGVRLLADLRAVFDAAGNPAHMFTAAILAELHAIEESPWLDLKGKPLDDRTLARRLRQYGVGSKKVRVGNTTGRGYDRAELADQWFRYAPLSPPASGTSGTSGTTPDSQGSNVPDAVPHVPHPAAPPETVPEKNGRKISSVPDVPHVPHPAGGRGEEAGFCVHCGRRDGRLLRVAVPDGPPEGVPLHRGCVEAWYALDIPEALRR